MVKALSYLPSALSLLRATWFVRRNRIQVLHATDRPRDASFVALLGRLSGAVSVVHVHAPVEPLSRATRWGLQRATATFAVSESIRQDLLRTGLPPACVHTLHNAVDVEHFDPDAAFPAGRSLREEFGIPAGAPIVGIAARMNPWKGQIELIGAVSLLRERRPDLHLVILGADVPEMRARYEQLARDGGILERVHFGGFRDDVRPFLREIDLFVHPSHAEPFGLAIAEAMAMRKPVIACGSGGVPEIITHGIDGWLVPERSPESVAEAIDALLGDPERCQSMATRARDTVRRRFTPRHQCAAATRLYDDLVGAIPGQGQEERRWTG